VTPALLLGEHGLRDTDGRVFDPASRSWSAGEGAPRGTPCTPGDAVRWLQRASGHPCRVPIGVIGPREPTPEQLAAGEALGTALAGLGLTLVCGGRRGVMEAASRGASRAGGIVVGLLPGDDPAEANPYVTVPITTGIGVARNAVLARAALCLVAVGGGYGTISEAAFGLQFGKVVIGLAGAPDLPGVEHVADAEAAAELVAQVVLALKASGRALLPP
jgi:uncharacterized protein (TIGR00725 family)